VITNPEKLTFPDDGIMTPLSFSFSIQKHTALYPERARYARERRTCFSFVRLHLKKQVLRAFGAQSLP